LLPLANVVFLVNRERSTTNLATALAEFQTGPSDERKARLLALRSKPRAIDVLTFIAELDCANAARKRRGVASRFCSLLESVQQYAAVMDTYSQLHADITSLVWGSVKLCIHVSDHGSFDLQGGLPLSIEDFPGIIF
jgi:hypothetical protein